MLAAALGPQGVEQLRAGGVSAMLCGPGGELAVGRLGLGAAGT